MFGEAWQVATYGPEFAVSPPPGGFGSEQEGWVYYELVRRRVAFVYNFRAGDNPFTPQRDELQLDFVIPGLHIVLNPRTPFTHPDPRKDVEQARDIEKLGYVVYYLDGLTRGNVDEKLDEIPGLGMPGQGPRRPTARFTGRVYGQPARNRSFGFRGF